MNTSMIHRQSGAALIVGMIMLVLITVMLVAAFNLGTTNMRATGNIQARNQALAAANVAIQQRVGIGFLGGNTAPTNPVVQLDDGGPAKFTVRVTPVCVGATIVFSAAPSSVSLGPTMSASPVWNTTWDIRADVADPNTGTAVTVRTGVRVQLPDADKILACG